MNRAAVETPLATERLTLEPLRLAHAAVCYPSFAQPSLYRYIEMPIPADEPDLRRRCAGWIKGSGRRSEVWATWIAVERRSSQPAGWFQATVHEGHADIAYLVFDAFQRRGMAVDSLVSSGCIVSGATVRRSVLFTRVTVGEGSRVDESVVLPGVRIGRRVRLRRVIVDKRCVLPDGFEAGLDPVADAARFHRTERGVVLVTPEMLGQNIHAGGSLLPGMIRSPALSSGLNSQPSP